VADFLATPPKRRPTLQDLLQLHLPTHQLSLSLLRASLASYQLATTAAPDDAPTVTAATA
jgi:hypothetical protein